MAMSSSSEFKPYSLLNWSSSEDQDFPKNKDIDQITMVTKMLSSVEEKYQETQKIQKEIKKEQEEIKKEQKVIKENNKDLSETLGENNTKFEEKTVNLDEKIKELKKDKSSLITILWIFVAFFTLVSMEIDVLKNVPDFIWVAWFSLLFVCLLVVFVFMIDFVSWRRIAPEKKVIHGGKFKSRFNSIPDYFKVWIILSLVFWIWWVILISWSQSLNIKKIDGLVSSWSNLQTSFNSLNDNVQNLQKSIQELQEKNIWLNSELELLKKENDIILQLKTQTKK